MATVSEGDRVSWSWGNGRAQGKVEKTYTSKITRKIKGTEVTKNGTEDNPAVYIEQDDGGAVLKLASEVQKTS